MKRQHAVKVWAIKRTLIMMVALFVSTVACQRSDAPVNNTAANTNNSPESSGTISLMTPNNSSQNQPQANVATNTSDQPVNKVEGTAKPGIQITNVPRKGPGGPDETETIAGQVSGVKVKDYKVVIFTHTDTWYVQPYIESPDTQIRDDGKWETDTHLGSEYAALLVKNSYAPPSKTGKLPVVGGPVLAIAREVAKR